MSNLTIYPIYNIRGIMNAWNMVCDGLNRILSFTYKDTNMTKVYNDLLGGNLLLWVIYIDGEYKGFMTTKIEEVPEEGRILWIVHLYGKDFSKEILLDGLGRIEKFAREQNCNTIRFLSMREEAFEKRLKDMGFFKGYTEFIKEISNV